MYFTLQLLLQKKKERDREYYAQNKERLKLKRRANGEGSSRSTSVIRDIGEIETPQMNIEPSQRVPLGKFLNQTFVITLQNYANNNITN